MPTFLVTCQRGDVPEVIIYLAGTSPSLPFIVGSCYVYNVTHSAKRVASTQARTVSLFTPCHRGVVLDVHSMTLRKAYHRQLKRLTFLLRVIVGSCWMYVR